MDLQKRKAGWSGWQAHTSARAFLEPPAWTEETQLFRQYDWFDEDTFLDCCLKQVHRKFPECYLFMDKALQQHYSSEKVTKYFGEHRDTLS